MSLFQSRDFWSFRPEGVEECDKGCLCVANIDNSPDGLGKYLKALFVSNEGGLTCGSFFTTWWCIGFLSTSSYDWCLDRVGCVPFVSS